MLKFKPVPSKARQQLIKDATSLESYFDALALLLDLVARMVPGQDGPRFAVADADQRLRDVRDSLKATVGAAVSDTVEDNRASVIAALGRPDNEEKAKSFIEALVVARRTVRRDARTAVDQAEFFRNDYRSLITAIMIVGATKEEAEDAVSYALVEAIRGWDGVKDHRRWISKAALDRFLREKSTQS
jgi:hypothetical protein